MRTCVRIEGYPENRSLIFERKRWENYNTRFLRQKACPGVGIEYNRDSSDNPKQKVGAIRG